MPPTVLLVASPQRQSRLLEVLDGRELQIECARGLLDAQEGVGGAVRRYDLLLVDAELPYGSWQDLLELARNGGTGVAAIVCARLGDDRLWAEVLEKGGYDLIVEPYEQQEVTRIVEGALNSRRLQQAARSRLEDSS